MPAPRKASKEPGYVDQLDLAGSKRVVNHGLSIETYYRTAQMLTLQASAYRAQSNEEQLYVMLLRFASLVMETIKDHKGFRDGDPRYTKLQSLLLKSVMPELERLKPSLRLKHIDEPKARSINRPANAIQISVSDMPQMNWGASERSSLPPPPPPSNQSSSFYSMPGLADDLVDFVNNPSRGGAASLNAPSSNFPSQSPISYSSSLQDRGASYPSGSYTTSAQQLSTFPQQPTSKYAASNQATSEKHSLFGSSSSNAERQSNVTLYPSAPTYPRYPELVRSSAPSTSVASTSYQQNGDPFQNHQNPGSNAQSFESNMQQLSLSLGNPSAGPSLGPQELQVINVPSTQSFHDHSGTCSAPPPPPGSMVEVGGPPASGIKELHKLAQLRDVHVSMALMEEFLAYAERNTSRGIESCGILAGRLQANDSIFNITTLIIPKQSGTTDTVQALNEEEIFDVQFKNELYPLGWIHTHPTQTCFLSSIDVHTHCGYQTMLDEAVAIVMAPTDRKNRTGIFRLSTPGGLGLVQKCTLRGFHTHPVPDSGQEIYDACSHVYLNAQTKHEVIDLR